MDTAQLKRMTDVVNHPSHYTQGGIECIDAIKAATVGKTGIEAVAVANVVKYLWRYEEKNDQRGWFSVSKRPTFMLACKLLCGL